MNETIDLVQYNKLFKVCEEFQNNDRNGTFEDAPKEVLQGLYTIEEVVDYLLITINQWREESGLLDNDMINYFDSLEAHTRAILAD